MFLMPWPGLALFGIFLGLCGKKKKGSNFPHRGRGINPEGPSMPTGLRVCPESCLSPRNYEHTSANHSCCLWLHWAQGRTFSGRNPQEDLPGTWPGIWEALSLPTQLGTYCPGWRLLYYTDLHQRIVVFAPCPPECDHVQLRTFIGYKMAFEYSPE